MKIKEGGPIYKFKYYSFGRPSFAALAYKGQCVSSTEENAEKQEKRVVPCTLAHKFGRKRFG